MTLLDRIARLIQAEQLRAEKAQHQGRPDKAKMHQTIRENTQRVYQEKRGTK